ncbi:SPOR domain-containing protein [Sphingomonas donggukensis]|uniref:SPOR domain-containing protein n=1 Tax=Sphingomonas donggukensis TaxID=2949093 RepID=A0ABY4TW19_9SPHN|nr:SPOR domain-containing protein [Sphingomonas donggukensis]URW76604.1 SPOR domain-containing protein [Sphingomonas donggukensis]
MKSHASLALLALWATAAAAQEPPAGEGPRGSSQVTAGEVRYDVVGYAGVGDVPGFAAVTDAADAGGYAEVTALDSGRTILVAVVAGSPGTGAIVVLSPAARATLGVTSERVPVRVRRVVPSPQDSVQLRNLQPASARSNAPEVLLVPLRRKLAAQTAVALPPAPPVKSQAPAPRQAALKPAPIPAPKPKPAPVVVAPAKSVSGAHVVQVAALSNAARAQALARQLGGTVIPAGALFRVQIGPFADVASADRARARAVAAGYPDSRRQRVAGH